MNYKNYIFIDRDDTLIVDKEYLSDPAGVEFPKGAIDGLKRLRDAGYGIILITNQSGIGRGYFTENDLTAVHNRLKELLAAEGLKLAAIYYCPHAPDANCNCRKPKTGMLEAACKDFDINLKTTAMFGDSKVDIADVTTLIAYLLKQNPSPFNEAAADVDGSSSIDIDDVKAIISLILKDS